jgi:hypothetical protein
VAEPAAAVAAGALVDAMLADLRHVKQEAERNRRTVRQTALPGT